MILSYFPSVVKLVCRNKSKKRKKTSQLVLIKRNKSSKKEVHLQIKKQTPEHFSCIRVSIFCQMKSVGVNADLLLRLGLVLKLNSTIDQSEEGVVLAYANVLAGANCGASLSYDDVAGNHCLTVSLLNAKALRLTVTAVLRGTNALLMSKEL